MMVSYRTKRSWLDTMVTLSSKSTTSYWKYVPIGDWEKKSTHYTCWSLVKQILAILLLHMLGKVFSDF
jgi:hypothetical protein